MVELREGSPTDNLILFPFCSSEKLLWSPDPSFYDKNLNFKENALSLGQQERLKGYPWHQSETLSSMMV